MYILMTRVNDISDELDVFGTVTGNRDINLPVPISVSVTRHTVVAEWIADTNRALAMDDLGELIVPQDSIQLPDEGYCTIVNVISEGTLSEVYVVLRCLPRDHDLRIDVPETESVWVTQIHMSSSTRSTLNPEYLPNMIVEL